MALFYVRTQKSDMTVNKENGEGRGTGIGYHQTCSKNKAKPINIYANKHLWKAKTVDPSLKGNWRGEYKVCAPNLSTLESEFKPATSGVK